VATGSQKPQHAVAFEALAGQLSIQPCPFALVGNARAPAETTLERMGQQRILVNLAGDFVQGRIRYRSGDPCCREPLTDAQQAAFPDRGFHARNRAGHARIVDCALGFEAVDGRIDGVCGKGLPGKTLPDLSFRELTPREHPHGGQIRVVHPAMVRGLRPQPDRFRSGVTSRTS